MFHHKRWLSQPLHKHRSAHLQNELFVFLQRFSEVLEDTVVQTLSAAPAIVTKLNKYFHCTLKNKHHWLPYHSHILVWDIKKQASTKYVLGCHVFSHSWISEWKIWVFPYFFFTPVKRMIFFPIQSVCTWGLNEGK